MQIETAFRQYTTRLREHAAGEDTEFAVAALEHLQGFVEREARQDLAEAIGGEELNDFVRHWYREEPQPCVAATEGLVRAVLGWAEWLDGYVLVPAGRPPVAPTLAWLEGELPRTARAAFGRGPACR